jgi:glutamyl-tRNA synthetase
MPDHPRVRFSPAPTGSLHVGSVRTALFNWLFARHHGGTFALRIEDTDRARSRQEWVVGIQDSLRWLGLEWDEGPVLQSARTQEYLAAADELLANGHAYECFCTEDEVKARSEAALAAGRPPGYDAHCRDLSADQRVGLAAEGRPRTIRFRTPDEGASHFVDAIRGEVRVEWSTVSDFVIVRSDGNPIFFLANAVDDLDMNITHVIRGEDLLDSTHRVLALRATLGAADRPVYAHLPLILGPDRSKLSKRHGAVAIEDFRDAGYLPEALVNYLALQGWAPEDGREVMEVEEIVAAFDLDRVTHAAAAFDHAKLDWMNGEWMRRLTLPEVEARAMPIARMRLGESFDVDLFHEAMRLGQERAVTLVDMVEQSEFLFVSDNEFSIPKEAWKRVAGTDRIVEVLDALIPFFETCEWNADSVGEMRAVMLDLGMSKTQMNKKTMPALYAIIEGRPSGLPLFDSIVLLGRERSLARLRAARERLTE